MKGTERNAHVQKKTGLRLGQLLLTNLYLTSLKRPTLQAFPLLQREAQKILKLNRFWFAAHCVLPMKHFLERSLRATLNGDKRTFLY